MPLGYKLAIFVVVSASFGWLTRHSLRSLRSHGLYRLLAVSITVALILLQSDFWFVDPFSAHQLAAWFLLAIGTYLVFHGAVALLRHGKPDSSRSDDSLVGIERTTQLVTTGIYRYIRHPIYAALLFVTWGAFFKKPSLIALTLAVAASVLLTVTARTEESENLRYFGSAYRDYMGQTRMFIPFWF